MRNSAHTGLDTQCNAAVTTLPIIHPLLLFDHTRYTHDVSFSILGVTRDHVSLSNSLQRAHCPSSVRQVNRSAQVEVRTGGEVTSRYTTSSTANPTWTAWGENPGRQLTAVTMTTAHPVPYISTRWFKYDRDRFVCKQNKSVPVIFEPPCIYKFTSTDPIVNCLHEAQVQQRRMLRPCTSWVYRRVVYKRSPMFRANLLPNLPGSIRYRSTQKVHMKYQYPRITLNNATAQETAIWNFTTMANQNLALQSSITKQQQQQQ